MSRLDKAESTNEKILLLMVNPLLVGLGIRNSLEGRFWPVKAQKSRIRSNISISYEFEPCSDSKPEFK